MAAAASAGDRRSLKEIIYDASAGAAAGAIAATFVCPLDVIKTRLQVHGLPEMQSSGRRGSVILVSLQTIVQNEGLKGLYRGLTPTLTALLPNWAIFGYPATSLLPLLKDDVLSAYTTQGMRHDVVPYKNIFSALRRIVHEEGFRGWYSGLLPSLAGISHVAIQFPTYERIKFYLAKRDNKSCNELSSWEVAIASSFSKVVASVSTYPHEVVRSRLQEQGQMRNSELQYAGVVDCIKKVFRKEGIPGFYRGCATNLLRTTPSAVITFTSYEMIHRFLQRVSPPDEKHSEPNPKPEGGNKPQKGITTIPEKNNNTLNQSVNPSNDRTNLIPLGNADKLTARH
ncbi:hypothetical protein DH2020_011894 [Rehmannia glutinosa]|uniref:Uncharacterized protein n=1 Tax=Rehmannia glutinosa TaxID=99300 RepID=A0ABR0XEU5_REHGL